MDTTTVNDNEYIAHLFKTDSYTFYELPSERRSIYPQNYGDLNEIGRAELDTIRSRARTEAPKKILTNAYYKVDRSGPWRPNMESKWYKSDHVVLHICSWDNVVLVAPVGQNNDGEDIFITTSVVKWYGPHSVVDGIVIYWAVTCSGSLYHYTLETATKECTRTVEWVEKFDCFFQSLNYDVAEKIMGFETDAPLIRPV